MNKDLVPLNPAVENEIRQLYQELLICWNNRSAEAMASLFFENGNSIGFDGSQMNGRAEIASNLAQIFADHLTAAYIGIVRDVSLLTAEVAVLRAVAGLVPRDQSNINPDANSVQTLVAARQGSEWRIAVFQNTPAAYHGRPEMREQLSNELRDALRSSGLRQ